GGGTATGGGGSGGPAPGEACQELTGDTIKFADTQFQTLWINDAIAQYIIEHGYCRPTESVTVTTPVAEQSLETGQLHVWMELWQFNIMGWYGPATKSGQVLDLGPVYDTSTQGWYVPTYVVKGDPERGIEPLAPDLESVFDLPKYWQIFKDPNDPKKGLFVNCIQPWTCSQVNEAKLHAYGLDKYYNDVKPGTAPALDATIAGAFDRGEPILFYYWEPTWLLGKYDATKLKEPPFSDECNAELQSVLTGKKKPDEVDETAGCAYQTYPIDKGVWAGLKDMAPEVVDFLAKMDVQLEPLEKTAAYMEVNDTTAEEAAIWYLRHYPDIWKAWVPADVAARVAAALEKEPG
ncbi:MAG: ABC transporter substrate-binding protein, partial [Clostridia bacterium]|nr:ABC transporter substrate-binding protein [Clostridia bacterium]